MSKRVTVEELRERLDDLRHGQSLTLVEDGHEIADIRPRRELNIIRHDPAFRLQDFTPAPRPRRLDFDAVQWLLDERERERSGRKYGV
jgi:hypothetical protein